jgi:hypothetical protein
VGDGLGVGLGVGVGVGVAAGDALGEALARGDAVGDGEGVARLWTPMLWANVEPLTLAVLGNAPPPPEPHPASATQKTNPAVNER